MKKMTMANGHTLLTIDGEAPIRRSIRAFFEPLGFKIEEAPSGSKGIEIARDKKPSLILINLTTPVMHGIEVIRSIVRELPEIPIIALSGTGSLQDALQAIREGAWDYAIMPVSDMAALEHGVNKALERAELLRENRRYRESIEQALSDKDALWQKIFSVAPYGIALTRMKDDTYVKVNPAFLRLSGYTAEEVIGKTNKFHLPSGEKEEASQAIKRLMEDGVIYNQEVTTRRKDGLLRNVSYSAAVLQIGSENYIVSVTEDITERKRTAEAIRKSEERFRKLIEASPLPILVAREGLVEFANAAYGRLVGLAPNETVCGRPFLELVASESRERIASYAAARGEGRQVTEHYQAVGLKRDGSSFPYEIHVSAIELPEGPVTLAFVSDLTESKRTEAALQLHADRAEALLQLKQMGEATLQEITQFALDAIVRLTQSEIGYLAFLSEDETVLSMHSWSEKVMPETNIADSPIHYVVQETGPWVEAIRQRRPVITNDFAVTNHLRKEFPAGHIAVQRHMHVPIFSGAQIVIVAGVGNKLSDYTSEDVQQLTLLMEGMWRIVERKRANEALRASEARYRSLIDGMHDIVYSATADGTISFISKQVQRYGFTPEEWIGRPIAEFVLEADRARAMRDIQHTIASGEKTQTTFRIHPQAGAEVWFEEQGRALCDDSGKIVGFTGTLRDVTERMHLESQLRQSQKLDAIGQLAGGIAHDLNNILAALMMHLDILQMDSSAESQIGQSLIDMQAEVNRAATLTRQLLMFSRRSLLTLKPLDVNEVVENLFKMLRRLIGEHIDLRFDAKTGLPSVEADAGMLEQVVMNLVVNARDAMPRGGLITIHTSLAVFGSAEAVANPNRREGRFVCLTVSDAGTGMDEETLKRIFDPFFTTKELGKGTGLGLATVHGIVAQHKGWVEVESQVDRGSSFSIFLPALARIPALLAPAVSVKPTPGGKETILLVEDDTSARKTITQVLRILGYRVFDAANGREAMSIWQEQHAQVDLLLTDMVMPEGMTGLELAERLHAVRPGLKTIISSGYSAEIVHAGVPTRQGVVYLPKPYSAAMLADVVRNCLDSKQ